MKVPEAVPGCPVGASVSDAAVGVWPPLPPPLPRLPKLPLLPLLPELPDLSDPETDHAINHGIRMTELERKQRAGAIVIEPSVVEVPDMTVEQHIKGRIWQLRESLKQVPEWEAELKKLERMLSVAEEPTADRPMRVNDS